MDDLRSLLVLNQNNLDRLRARVRYFNATLSNTEFDIHKLYGPYAEFWDEWHEQTELMKADVHGDVTATESFVVELREFITYAESSSVRRTSKVLTQRCVEMNELAREAIICQHDMLHMADVHIADHREFTDRLLLVEAIDNLSEE